MKSNYPDRKIVKTVYYEKDPEISNICIDE
jgi:hypothetical protein